MDFDEQTRRQNAEIAAQSAREDAQREGMSRESQIAFARLRAILAGERPTRESNEQWAARRGMLPAMPPAGQTRGGMLDLLIDARRPKNTLQPVVLPSAVGGVRG